MQDFIPIFFQFMIKHWFLWALFAIILFLILWTELRNLSGGFPRLSTQSAIQLINHQNALIIDIRSRENFNQGHIIGARNIPLDEITQNIDKLQKFKARPIIIVCNMGQLAAKAAQQLKQKNFEKVYLLQGGLNGWKQAGMPLEKVS